MYDASRDCNLKKRTRMAHDNNTNRIVRRSLYTRPGNSMALKKPLSYPQDKDERRWIRNDDDQVDLYRA